MRRAPSPFAPIAPLAGVVLAAVACATPRAPAPRPAAADGAAAERRTATVEELVRVRCATDGREVLTTWQGAVFAFVPGERPRRLFGVVGMNVARCLRDRDGWRLTSRELMYYLTPDTGQLVDRWANPWTAEEVPVVHVANRVVQTALGGAPPLLAGDGLATIVLDVPVYYPDPFAGDAALAPYAPGAAYQSGEFFALTVPAAILDDPALPTAPTMTFTWHRVGPWLPWMHMGGRPGQLVYSAHGRKVASVDELPAVLRAELTARLPLYAHAPPCVLDARNETSWTYFARHLAEYRAGARFPLAAPVVVEPCAAR